MLSAMQQSPIYVDGHLDIACNIRRLGRGDLDQPSHFYRERERRTTPGDTLQCTVSFPEMRRAGLRLIFATLFEDPGEHGFMTPESQLIDWPRHVEGLFLDQIETYQRLESVHPDFRPVRDLTGLDKVLLDDTSIGYVLLMEGADAITSPAEVKAWKDRGVRIVGLHWNNPNQYGGSCRAPGPLTPAGRELLREMQAHELLLDLSHASEETCLDALDCYDGTVVITHSACRALVPKERLTSDAVYDRLIERDSVLGMALFSPFLRSGLESGRASLEDMVRHVDHWASRAGRARHIAIGSDLDGGFGAEKIPQEMDTIADWPLIGEALLQHGYSDNDVRGILGGNWVRVLRKAWGEG